MLGALRVLGMYLAARGDDRCLAMFIAGQLMHGIVKMG